MRVLAIGGTGFVGRSAVHALQDHGHDVWTLARSPAEGQHLVGDRSRRGGLADAIAGRSWDAVVDLAAYQPWEMQEAVEVFSGSLRRYVFVSSGAVYAGAAGSAEAGAPIPDGELPSEELDYAEGKRWCEAVLARAIAAGFPGVVLRPPAVLGAGDHTGRIAGYLARVEDGGSLLALQGLVDAEVGVAWSRDVGRVSAQLCEGAGAESAYNVGFDRLTLRAFLDACAAALSVPPPMIVEVTAEELERTGLSLLDVSPYGPRRRTPGGWTIGRARAELSFEPSPLPTALEECVAWFRERRPPQHGYERRRDELKLAERLSRASDS
jgi:2'-hydroxyisoflavone reductase